MAGQTTRATACTVARNAAQIPSKEAASVPLVPGPFSQLGGNWPTTRLCAAATSASLGAMLSMQSTTCTAAAAAADSGGSKR